MLITVDRTSSEPLYRQVRKAIERAITSGTVDTQLPMPSSRELAQELGLSRNTINLAYQELVAEGFVEGRLREGMFVNREMRLLAADAPGKSGGPVVNCGVAWRTKVRTDVADSLPEVEKYSDWFTYPYPFLVGQADIRAFPSRAWLRCLREALFHPHVYYSLQDSTAADDPLLLEMICSNILPTRGIEAHPDQVLVTIGTQNGLELLSRALLGTNSLVAVEDPGYLDARHIFVRSGAKLHPLPVDGSGATPPASLVGIDLLHLTPSHQHPTNVTLSIGRRRQLLSLAQASGTVIVEDDYDSEFRYHGSPTPALKALDESGHVIYLGTVSTFLAPGLRLGYLVGPVELITELRKIRRYSYRHPSGHSQRALALLIESGDYHRALRRYRRQLRSKWESMTEAVNRYLPWSTVPPAGGVSLWITGPSELDARMLSELAQRHGVLIEPGDIYFLSDPPPTNNFRLGLAAIPLSAIDPGIQALGPLVRAILPSETSLPAGR